MKKLEKKLLWWKGAKFGLKALKISGGDMKEEAQNLLNEDGMMDIWRDDYWVHGFIAMLRRQAGIRETYVRPIKPKRLPKKQIVIPNYFLF